MTIESTPIFAREDGEDRWLLSSYDLSLSGRVELLLDWSEASDSNNFVVKALQILDDGELEMTSWRDGQSLPSIHWRVRKFVANEQPLKTKLLEAIESRLVTVIESGVAPDDLINIIKSVHEFMDDETPEAVEDAISSALHYEFYETSDAISHLGSEQELSEHLEHLEALSSLTGEDADGAKDIVAQRLGELEEPDYEERRPSFSTRESAAGEEFSDGSMRSLFLTLLR